MLCEGDVGCAGRIVDANANNSDNNEANSGKKESNAGHANDNTFIMFFAGPCICLLSYNRT